MPEVEKEKDQFSPGDKMGCLIFYLLAWVPFTAVLIGFAGSVTNYAEAILEGAADGDIFALIYLLCTFPLLAIPVFAIRALFSKNGSV